MNVILLAWKNISRKKFQSITIFLLILLTGFGIYTSSVLGESLSHGLRLSKERMGSDMIIVPKGYVSSVENALFDGKACTLLFSENLENQIADVPGVEKVSSQLYLASLSSGCCDGETQLIAIELATDFVVGPWMMQQDITKLQPDEIILGASFQKKPGETITYFHHEFTVISVLEETGGGYDQSAFISYEAAKEMAQDERNKNQFAFTADTMTSSMLHIKLKENADFSTVKDQIESRLAEGEEIYTTSQKFSAMAGEVSRYEIFAGIFNVWNLLLTALALFMIYTLSTYHRKNEIGSMLTIGIDKRKICLIFGLENILLISAGILSATILSQVLLLLFKNAWKGFFHLPVVIPSWISLIRLAFCLLGMNLFITLLAMSVAFYWIYKKEPAELVKEVS